MSSSAINNARRALRSFQTEEQHFNDYMKKSVRSDGLKIDLPVCYESEIQGFKRSSV